ncbi:MAG: prefoldin subunit alpha [Candidatus Methanogranum gryphiswaldense]|nr:MAG: prefoldin subunit alpha [Candidatus Methanogranum sp. U3.2.1]
MEDGELRQAMAVLESYNKQLESLGRQAQVLQASMDDILRARETLKALKDAKEGDEVLLPIGASSYINVNVSAKTKVIVNVGNRVSIEKTIDEAIEFAVATGNECSDTLKNAVNAMGEIECLANDLTMAIQNEYRNKQQKGQ